METCRPIGDPQTDSSADTVENINEARSSFNQFAALQSSFTN